MDQISPILIGIYVFACLLSVFVIASRAMTNTGRARPSKKPTDVGGFFALYFAIIEDRNGPDARRALREISRFLEERYGKGNVYCFGFGEFAAVKRFEPGEQRQRRQLEETEACLGQIERHIAVRLRAGSAASGAVKLESLSELVDLARYAADVAKERRLDFLICDDALALEKKGLDELYRDIGGSLEKDEFRPFFFPVISAEDLKIKGCSVQMVWNKDKYREIDFEMFSDIAQKKGIVREIEARILGKSLALLKQWIDAGLAQDDFFVEVSLSGETLDNINWKELIGRLSDFGLSSRNMLISAGDASFVQKKLNGIEVAAELDRIFPPAAPLKRVNIKGPWQEDKERAQLIGSLIEKGASLLAKDIEDKSGFDLARRLEIPLLCGRYFTRKLDGEDFERFLKKYREGIPLS